MKKVFNFVKNNILFIISLFLFSFIPLYPKLPIVGVTHTWVYVRLEDFIIAAVLVFLLFLVLFKKIKLKTPLTVPIFLFWLIGGLATLHGVLLIFPTIANVFPNVAILSFLRRIEYLSLFFIGFLSIRDKKNIYPLIWTISITLLLIILYGAGQKLLGFPAFLTGNEEFAKGEALKISSLGRITSTFAGHYDLAAYLVLVIPVLVSLAFGFKNLLIKLSLLAMSLMGFGLLFLTVSRISLFALLFSLVVLLILQKRKIALFSLLFLTLLFLILFPKLLQRFNNTVTEVDVLVNALTGNALGQVIEVPKEHFKDKIILRDQAFLQPNQATISSLLIFPYSSVPQSAEILLQPNVPTGETLPQGTGYINLPLSPILKRSDRYFTEKTDQKENATSTTVREFEGSFLVKKARAYDLSFTTRFQGEWPATILAFKRNIFLGSGYGSVSLAVDNNYLRLLGESGILGFAAFVSIFLFALIFIKKSFNMIDSPLTKSLVLGLVVGTLGLLINSFLIDVFEASKVAFPFWLLLGFTLGLVKLYNPGYMDYFKETKRLLTSNGAVIFYIFAIVLILFLPSISNYFIGDDFTWLRWSVNLKSAFNSFINSQGFFYRPGSRIYYSLLYQIFWLNQTMYHVASIFLHFVFASLLFIVLKKTFKSNSLSIISTFLFLSLSAYHEAIFWISATGFLFTGIFSLLSLLLFIFYKEEKKVLYLFLSLLSMVFSLLFQELGVIAPLLVVIYDLIFWEGKLRFKKLQLLFISPLIPYLILRLVSHSQWFSGDYSYNFLKLPYNVLGNLLGYIALDMLGPLSLKFYETSRIFLRGHLLIAGILIIIFIYLIWIITNSLKKSLSFEEKKIMFFGILFFLISLLPFLGLGNITSRYVYLPTVGFAIVASLLLKKFFTYMSNILDKTALILISTIAVIFFLSFQLFQLQKLHTDWTAAAQEANTFLVSFEGNYKDYWNDNHMDFYFVNVPIKKGEAWIFPVGLKDAISFAFPKLNMKVYTVASLEEAFLNNPDPSKSGVFLFNDDGSVTEYIKTKSGQIIPR